MPPPIPKPRKLSPEERKAERKSRPPNPFKSRIGEQDVQVKPDPLDHHRYRPDGSSLHSISRRKLAELKESGKSISSTFRAKPGQRPLSHKRRVQERTIAKVATRGWTYKRGRIKPVGERGKRLRPGDDAWRKRIWEIWGSCILTGEVGPHVHAHHCHDKGHNALEWRTADWNGLLLRWDIHQMADEYPEFHQACQWVADECRAAAEGKRPPVTRGEARSMICQKAPKMRRYAKAEEV